MLRSKIRFFFISFMLVSAACKDIHQVIPSVPVNISLDATTELAKLGVGSAIICPKPGGYMGIILYRKDIYEYVAYERTCTYYPNDTSAVDIDSTGVFAVCKHCGSKFILLLNGDVNQSPARLPLKQYNTYFDEYSKRLYISN
jgi:hypothetical protein